MEAATLFLPFVFKDPCLAWGLPGDFFQPEALLDHVVGLLKPGGVLLITNQGLAEAAEQRRLLRPLEAAGRLQLIDRGAMPDAFLEYRYRRYGWFCRKPGGPGGEA